MKKTIFSLATLAMIAASCSDEVVNRTPDSLKDIISFSSDGTEGLISGSQTRAGFTAATDMVIRLQSDNRTNASDVKYTRTIATAYEAGTKYYSSVGSDEKGYLNRYWDDAHGRNSLLSAYAVAVPNKTLSDTKLSESSLKGGTTWATETTPDNTITWSVSTTNVTTTNLENEDLAYSNNIQADETLGIKGRYVWDYESVKDYVPQTLTSETHSQLGNKRMRFTQKDKLEETSTLGTEAGHFDKGHLHFQHALSRMTIQIVEGDGFTKSETTPTDFKWTKNGSKVSYNTIQILENTVGTSGTLDVKAGSWGDPTNHTKAGISTLATLGTSYNSSTGVFSGDYVDAQGYYRAQMIPGFVFAKDGTTNVLQFSIDNNTIKVTDAMIFKALYDNAGTGSGKNGLPTVEADGTTPVSSYTMEQGKNYVLEITVKKTGIQAITATVAPWVDIAGKIEVNNAHLTFDLKTSGKACDKDIDLYRLGEDNPGFDADQYKFDYKGIAWGGNYTDKVVLLQSAKDANNKWSTSWFFESNKTYYHFRTVNKDTRILDSNDANPDYFLVNGGSQSNTDPHWGAPFNKAKADEESKSVLLYDVNDGYKYVHYAIGATKSDINIQEIHMLSNINVILKTKDDGSKVQLYKPAVDAVKYADYNEYKTAVEAKGGTPMSETEYNNLVENATQRIKTPAQDAVPTKIYITRLSTQGKVYMGNGKVEPIAPVSPATYNDAAFSHTMDGPAATSASTFFKTNDTETNVYSYAVVPQELCRVANSTTDDDYVGIFIQTPDNNQYYVIKRLSEIYATTVSDQRNQTQYNESGTDAEKEASKIKRWFPGHNYTYTITITKTGIQAITATVADWVDVEGKNIDINLEN